MRVDLSENELRVARIVAVERQLYGRKKYEDKKKIDDGFQADVDGMVGEMCFGKLFNYYVDLDWGRKGRILYRGRVKRLM